MGENLKIETSNLPYMIILESFFTMQMIITLYLETKNCKKLFLLSIFRKPPKQAATYGNKIDDRNLSFIIVLEYFVTMQIIIILDLGNRKPPPPKVFLSILQRSTCHANSQIRLEQKKSRQTSVRDIQTSSDMNWQMKKMIHIYTNILNNHNERYAYKKT